MDTNDSTPGERPIPAPPWPLGLIAYRSKFFCVACRAQTVTVGAARCHACQDEPMRGCWRCGYDLADLIDSELLRRVTGALDDLRAGAQAWWLARGGYRAWLATERVLEARKGPQQ